MQHAARPQQQLSAQWVELRCYAVHVQYSKMRLSDVRRLMQEAPRLCFLGLDTTVIVAEGSQTTSSQGSQPKLGLATLRHAWLG
jgi:hypothetical protein